MLCYSKMQIGNHPGTDRDTPLSKGNSMALFCVFTPAYNRAYTLTRLYESLKRQAFTDFVWVITNDGSTDGTDEVVQGFINEGILDIRYNRCENGGKTRAVAAAAEASHEELFICIDSDDWFTDNALSILNSTWQRVKSDQSIAGMIALHGLSAEQTVGTHMPSGVTRTNAWDLYYKYHFKGDCVHIYRTEIFKQYPAPVAEGEKYLSEAWTFNHIAQLYDVVLIDEIVHIGEYLPDGLSRNVRQLTKDNPISYSRSKAFDYEMSHTLYQKMYSSILYMVGCILAKKKHAIKDAPNSFLAVLSVPVAWILLKTVFK